MASSQSLVKELLDAGVHFGHKAANWNPKMTPYIFGKKNGIHIIDVRQTIKGLLLAKRFINRTVAGGKDVLVVGTKRQARESIQRLCDDAEMPYVVERWLGGTLTNFRTIRSRLKRLDELEKLMASEEWTHYSKKMASQLIRERKKIHRNLSGVRGMNSLPGAMVVIDVRREVNALREAQKLGIPTVCLIDTDSDPDLADIPIPGNDDAMRAVETIVRELMQAAKEGKTARAQVEAEQKEQEAPATTRRRSARAQFRAEEDPAASPTPAAPAAPTPEAQVSGTASSHVTEEIDRIEPTQKAIESETRAESAGPPAGKGESREEASRVPRAEQAEAERSAEEQSPEARAEAEAARARDKATASSSGDKSS